MGEFGKTEYGNLSTEELLAERARLRGEVEMLSKQNGPLAFNDRIQKRLRVAVIEVELEKRGYKE